MRLLLDENLPHDLRHFIAGHDVATVAYMGWDGRKNGHLLATAAGAGFDALITMDTGIEFQHHLPSLPCSVVVLEAPTNKLPDLMPLVTPLLDALAVLKPRTLVHVRENPP